MPRRVAFALHRARPLPPRLLRHVVLTIAVRACEPPAWRLYQPLHLRLLCRCCRCCRCRRPHPAAHSSPPMTLPPVSAASGPNRHCAAFIASRSPELAIKFYSKPPPIFPPAGSAAHDDARCRCLECAVAFRDRRDRLRVPGSAQACTSWPRKRQQKKPDLRTAAHAASIRL
jgi:hypothetical protein